VSESTPLSSAETIRLFERCVTPNYNRYPVALVRGEGSYVWDAEGNRYLDFFCGWGCNLLGHCPPPVVEAVRAQLGGLIHVPNTWYTELQGRWAEALSQRSFGGQAFFCNSGAEAVEAAMKLARLYGAPKHRYKIITFEGGFHGRTLATTTATAQPKYHQGLGPLMAGFLYAPFGDPEAVRKLIDAETVALMVEPIQGEGGVRIPPDGFLPGLRQLADEHELLLIFDEVTTGCGRTGRWFAYEHFGIEPDVMTLAKALCGGLAGGAMLARPELARCLLPGIHASTFGGNPIAARAGLATLETIEREGLLERASRLGELFEGRLTELQRQCDLIREVRVRGVMIGIELSLEGASAVRACMERKLLINCTNQTVLRLYPAMNLTEQQAHEGLDILADVLKQLAKNNLPTQ
jgi:acetylornithine/N-succinyldiaminopimelate aminotransferase